MSFVAVAVGGAAVLGAGASIYAADKQAKAAGAAAGAANAQYQQSRADLSPWRTTGVAANNKLAQLLGILPSEVPFAHGPGHFDSAGYEAAAKSAQGSPDFGSLLKSFSPGDLTQDPGYQFGVTEGEKGLNRSAAARGMYFSPATSKELSTFNQDYAGTKFNDAFSRDQASKNQLYGFLSGASGAGENAAGQTANLGANNAATVGNLTTSGAAANAAGAVGVANAATGGAGQYLNYSNQSRLLDLLNSSRAPTTNYNPSSM